MAREPRIMLLLTEACNLNCVYCYEHNKKPLEMSFQTAKSILDSELNNASPEKAVVIELFGGEAFINFSLMVQIDEYLAASYSNLEIRYETTTNGTFVHGDIQKWLYERRKRFSISLSLDGTPSMHDKNRVFFNGIGTYNAIDVDFFINTWPGCTAKMTLSEETLPDLARGVEYIENLGFKCDATLSIGRKWIYEEATFILIRELSKLVDYYISRPSHKLCTMLDFDLRQVFTPFDEDYRFCGAGVDMQCFDTCGNAYPCQGFAPISIGEKAITYHNFDETQFKFTDANVCKHCQWVRLCPNCYAANLQSTNDIQQVDTGLCGFYKLCILASSKIQCVRLHAKLKHTHDDLLILKAISHIQANIR